MSLYVPATLRVWPPPALGQWFEVLRTLGCSSFGPGCACDEPLEIDRFREYLTSGIARVKQKTLPPNWKEAMRVTGCANEHIFSCARFASRVGKRVCRWLFSWIVRGGQGVTFSLFGTNLPDRVIARGGALVAFYGSSQSSGSRTRAYMKKHD